MLGDGEAPEAAEHTDGPVTLAQAAERYLDHLRLEGRSEGTVNAYAGDLALATGFLGAETALGEITRERVVEFSGSDLVTRTRTGRPKAGPTVDKTRRVLRQMLAWASGAGLIAEDPGRGLGLGRRERAEAQ